ncbi:hypothetical protein PV762_05285 [Mitsuaria sp. CC2]|uniref:glycosyltransferase n=1 Tax=Mitsuaria sp. CC2 TaxID=3029186 RepID=UPI003B8CD6F1
MPAVVFACTLDTHAFESLLPFATALARRGYRVHFLAEPTFRVRTEAAGIAFEAMRHAQDTDDIDDGGIPCRTAVARRLLSFAHGVRRHHVDRVRGQHASLQSLLERLSTRYPGEATVLIHDTMFLGAWPLLLGAPGHRPAAVLSIGVMPLPATDAFLAPFGTGLPPDRSENGRRLHAAMDAQLRELFAGAQAALSRTLKRCGATRPPPFVLDGMLTLPDRFLQLGVAPLEYPRRDPLPNLRFIGLAPLLPSAAALPVWWSDLDTARPVVFLAAGRVAGGDLDPLVLTTLYALHNEPVLIVVTVDWDAQRFGPLPVNARAARSLPPEALLPWVDVMVSHGGDADVQRALSQGIPVVLGPEDEAQRELAARVVHAGAGVQLTSPIYAEEILTAVQTVLETLSFLAAAHRLRKAYHRHDAVAAVIAAVEAAADPGTAAAP